MDVITVVVVVPTVGQGDVVEVVVVPALALGLCDVVEVVVDEVEFVVVVEVGQLGMVVEVVVLESLAAEDAGVEVDVVASDDCSWRIRGAQMPSSVVTGQRALLAVPTTADPAEAGVWDGSEGSIDGAMRAWEEEANTVTYRRLGDGEPERNPRYRAQRLGRDGGPTHIAVLDATRTSLCRRSMSVGGGSA